MAYMVVTDEFTSEEIQEVIDHFPDIKEGDEKLVLLSLAYLNRYGSDRLRNLRRENPDLDIILLRRADDNMFLHDIGDVVGIVTLVHTIGEKLDTAKLKLRRIMTYNSSDYSIATVGLVVYCIGELGPELLYSNFDGHGNRLSAMAVKSMLLASDGKNYKNGLDIMLDGDTAFIVCSFKFADLDSTDKRVRERSLIQICLAMNEGVYSQLPPITALQPLFFWIEKEYGDKFMAIKRLEKIDEFHQHLVDKLTEMIELYNLQNVQQTWK